MRLIKALAADDFENSSINRKLPMPASNKLDRPPLAWELDVPILAQPLVLRSLATLWIVAALVVLPLMGGIVAITNGIRAAVPLAVLILLLTGGLAIVSILILLLVFGSRMRMAFVIDDHGVVMRVIDKRARAANRLAAALGGLSGRPGLAGAGLIAVGGEEKRLVWSGVAEARYDPLHRTITLGNAWRPLLYVFCTPESYDEAKARIAGSIAEVPRTGRRRNPLWTALGITSLVVIATLPLFGMPYPFEADLFAVIFTLCFMLATVWLLPVMGWPTLAGVAWIAATIMRRGFAVHTIRATGDTYTGFQGLQGAEWLGILFGVIGLAILASLAIAALCGRMPSLLMQDTADMEGPNR